MEVNTITASPAAGPLTPNGEPLATPTTIPPTMPAMMPANRVCLKNAAGDENAVFGFWVSVPFWWNSGVLLPQKDTQHRFQKMRFQPGEHFSDTL
jgi:hypothetical protein